MPCVFPVLSMKAASLAAHAHQESEARAQGLAFLAGVLVTFLALAGAAPGAQGRRGGGRLGLPAAVAGGGRGAGPGHAAGGAQHVRRVRGDLPAGRRRLPGGRAAWSAPFFTGVLAVVVAAPCTAPFMAPALGFALTQSAPAALLVFVGLGLGFAAPVRGGGLHPRPCCAVCRGPAPGWTPCKHCWPSRCTARRPGCVGVRPAGGLRRPGRMLAAAVLVGFGAWLLGEAQSGKPLVPGLAAGVAAVLAIACLVFGARETAPGRRPDRFDGSGRRAGRGRRQGSPVRALHRRAAGRAAGPGQAGVRQLHRRLVRHLPGQRAPGARLARRWPRPWPTSAPSI